MRQLKQRLAGPWCDVIQSFAFRVSVHLYSTQYTYSSFILNIIRFCAGLVLSSHVNAFAVYIRSVEVHSPTQGSRKVNHRVRALMNAHFISILSLN